MTLSAAMTRWRPVVIRSGVLGGGAAVLLAVWQTGKIVSACMSRQCLPGPGLGLMLFAGGAAAYQGIRLLRYGSL